VLKEIYTERTLVRVRVANNELDALRLLSTYHGSLREFLLGEYGRFLLKKAQIDA